MNWQIITDCSGSGSYHSNSYADDDNEDGCNNHKHIHNSCCNLVNNYDAIAAK
jgi:hypothetical protein